MASKKALIGILVIGALVFVATLPMIIYGTSVETAEFDIALTISGSDPTSSSIQTQAEGDYSVSNASVDFSEGQMNPYEYALMRMSGDQVEEEGESEGEAVADIGITFELETPSGKKLSFSFKPQELEGTGEKEMKVTLGPEDLNGETGTFYLKITISISITPPISSTPVFEKELNPVTLEFEVQ